MAQSDDEQERRANERAGLNPWVDTAVVWGVVALGGIGVGFAYFDPLGRREMVSAALTVWACFAGAGAVATLLIWCWPAGWHRWFRQIPADGSPRLEIAKMVAHAASWILGIVVIACMVTWQWSPITAGAAAGCLLVGRLALDLVLQHWLGDRPASRSCAAEVSTDVESEAQSRAE